MTIIALLGAGALWLTYAWLAAAIIGAYLSHRKGFGERPGLASGLLLNFLGPLIWLFVPAKEESLWKTVGPWGSTVKAEKDRQLRGGSDQPASSKPGPGPDPGKPSSDVKPSSDDSTTG